MNSEECMRQDLGVVGNFADGFNLVFLCFAAEQKLETFDSFSNACSN